MNYAYIPRRSSKPARSIITTRSAIVSGTLVIFAAIAGVLPKTDDALKGTPQVLYPNDGTGFSKPLAPTPEPKEKSGPEIV
jgi:hypothetical protein